ncbi:winged helix-turn-helix domain-containing protein [Henriciella mobilis]|nr:winged helix-turn-helix domain-containing protein [Henriciella mobilis]
MQKPRSSKDMKIGDWLVEPAANRLRAGGNEVELEPRVMDLLMLLAEHPGKVISKPDIAKALWGDIHVNDDALTRTVFKLRKALGDDARDARYIETVSKRGYRLIADVGDAGAAAAPRGHLPRLALLFGGGILAAGLAGLLTLTVFRSPEPASPVGSEDQRLSRADGFYSQFNRSDNEAALRLYETILEESPGNGAALAGLANALTQRLVRYEGAAGPVDERTSLTEALEGGWLDTARAQDGLDRAIGLARRATRADPSHDRAWRALGLALSARREFDEAERAYERALVINPDDWGTMINLSELYLLTGRPERSTPYLEQAWRAMEAGYGDNPVAIRPWHSSVGLAVAERYLEAGDPQAAELWYRRVLSLDPLNPQAVRGLAQLLRQFGDASRADALCLELENASGETC